MTPSLRAALGRRCPLARVCHVAVCAALLSGWLLIFVARTARAEKWPAIPREDLELPQPLVDRKADAEAIFWEIRVTDALSDLSRELWHHVRVKVFTEQGRERQSKVDLLYERGQQISDISARSVSPAGQVVEMNPEEVYERTLVKANRVRLQVKSFVVPGVEIGSIVEYRWREFRGTRSRTWGYFDLQRDIPAQRITYRVKPVGGRDAPPLRMIAHNAAPSAFANDGSGFHSTSVTRVPAYVEEPDMPPEYEARRWMFLYYATEDLVDPAARWRHEARDLLSADEDMRRDGRELRKRAMDIAGDSPDPEERLRRVHAYCRTRIVNLQRRAAGLNEEERMRLESNKHASATFEAGQGTGDDINRLFASLCAGAGFDVRLARLPDRQFIYFNPANLYGYLSARSVAVRVGDRWQFFDPASYHVPFGMLRWQEEGVQALVQEKGEPLWLTTPLTPSVRSAVVRTGSFRLLEDGTLEGVAQVELSGHPDIEEKLQLEESSASERERSMREAVAKRMPAAELADVKYEHLANPESTTVFRYRLRVPGFAKATGKRLFFQPSVFQYGKPPRIETGTRWNGVDLRFPWSEEDSVVVDLPAGYRLDNPEAPSELDVRSICNYHVRLSTTHEGSRLVYRRHFQMDQYYFDRRVHSSLKEMFYAIFERDQYSLALRPAGATEP